MRNVTKESEIKCADNSYAKISPIKRALRTKAFPLFVLLVVVVAVFTVLSPLSNDGFQAFFRIKTLWRILQDLAVPGFLTIGVGLLIVSGSIDLCAASVGSLSGVIIAVCMAWTNISWPVAIVIALATAAAIGVINAILVNELKQPPFIATMAMSIILTAVMQIICTDKTGQIIGLVNFSNDSIQQIGTYKIFGEIPAASLVMVLFFIIYGLALAKSKFGRTLYLIGGNQTAAHLAGINAKVFILPVHQQFCAGFIFWDNQCFAREDGRRSGSGIHAYRHNGRYPWRNFIWGRLGRPGRGVPWASCH